ADWNQTPVLSGDEAAHNGALARAQQAIRDLMTQELAEGGDEWDCVAQLAYLGSCLRDWAFGEQAESYSDDGSGELAVSVLMAAQLEDRAERATSIRHIAK